MIFHLKERPSWPHERSPFPSNLWRGLMADARRVSPSRSPERHPCQTCTRWPAMPSDFLRTASSSQWHRARAANQSSQRRDPSGGYAAKGMRVYHELWGVAILLSVSCTVFIISVVCASSFHKWSPDRSNEIIVKILRMSPSDQGKGSNHAFSLCNRR